MNSIRAFIISSSMFLTVWLAASYTTQLEAEKPTPTAQTPSNEAVTTVSTPADREQDAEPMALLR